VGTETNVERERLGCPECGRDVVSGVSLSQKWYRLDPDPVDAVPGTVIFVSPSGTIRKAIPGDQCEKYLLHRCRRDG
jgi:hypothetical protein